MTGQGWQDSLVGLPWVPGGDVGFGVSSGLSVGEKVAVGEKVGLAVKQETRSPFCPCPRLSISVMLTSFSI